MTLNETLNEKMPTEDAIAELQNVGARIRLWSSQSGLASIYVNDKNGQKLAQVWVRHGQVSAQGLWNAVHVWITKGE